MHDLVTILAADGTILFESPSLEDLLGFRPEQVIGRPVFEFVHPEDVMLVSAAFKQVSEQDSSDRADPTVPSAHRQRRMSLAGRPTILLQPAGLAMR
jgi:PAS domain S-box-containing protein